MSVCVCGVCVSGCADLHLLDMLSPMERKRQGYIHELIVTEENYVNDLQLVTEVNAQTYIHADNYSMQHVTHNIYQVGVCVFVCLCADLPQTSAGVRAADGEGGGDDLRQLEGAHHVQHQTAQVRTERHKVDFIVLINIIKQKSKLQPSLPFYLNF